jgi:putative ABC transport system permease protein
VGRQKELAIRMSLGASRGRVMRQLLTEGIVIALLGGVVGLFISYFGIQGLRAGLNFNDAVAAVPVSLDRNVLLFAMAISLVSAVLSSVAPALKSSRTDINTDLKSETRGATSGRSHNRMRVFLVGGEIALALFLLIGSCILIRGVYQLDHQQLGFNHDHLLTAAVQLDEARYADATKQAQFVQEAIGRLQQIPGVQSVAVASDLPASGPGSVPIHIKGQVESNASEVHTALDVVVSPEYFDLTRIPLLQGRTFTGRDDGSVPGVVIVNQEFMRKYFPGQNPVGKQIQLDVTGVAPAWYEIVGVVADVKSYSEDPRTEPEVYEAWAQRPCASFSFLVRSNVEPNSLIPALRRAFAELDAELPLLRVMNMDQVIDKQRSGNPLFTKLLAAFAGLALILSAIGIYGLIAYSVGQRTQEIGIRMALGAKTRDISRMILRESFKVTAIGSSIGLVLALPLPTVFDSMFQGLPFRAPGVYPLVLVVMLAVAFGATYVPARRATHIDPTRALRSE